MKIIDVAKKLADKGVDVRIKDGEIKFYGDTDQSTEVHELCLEHAEDLRAMLVAFKGLQDRITVILGADAAGPAERIAGIVIEALADLPDPTLKWVIRQNIPENES